jgi:hypothetical protein
MLTTVLAPHLVVFALLVSCAYFDTVDQAQAQQGNPTLKAIADAWSKRQSDLKTVKIVWRQELAHTHLKRVVLAYESVSTLFLDRDSVALMHDIYGPPRAGVLEGPEEGIPLHTKSILKGSESLHYTAPPQGELHGWATFKPASKFKDFQMSENGPLALALRPLTANVGGIDLATYHLAKKRSTVNGVSCMLLEPTRDDTFTTSYWVDPARGYLILRAVGTLKGQDVVTTDILYERNAASAWFPKRWDVAGRYFGQGESTYTIHGHTLKVILNEPIDPNEFNLGELPVGTPVHDGRSGRWIERRIEPPAPAKP